MVPLSTGKRRQLQSTVAALQRRYGAQAIRPASDLPTPAPPPAITTGFAQLDALTGCRGIPLGALTLLSGCTTSGKTTLAFKTLAHAQQPEPASARRTALHNVARLDLNHTCDPDYLARCGVDLAHLLIVLPLPDLEPVGYI
jgi:RecA/RadA recombinase